MKIFSGGANKLLAEKIVSYLGIPLGDVSIYPFSDGEFGIKYNESIRGVDVFIIQPTNPPSDNLMELLLLIDAAVRASAARVTAVIPYFGYARQDRKDQPRVALSAKLVANMISTAGANRVLTMDLHSPSIQGFFDIPFDHLYSSPIFVDMIKNMNRDDLVVVSPDIGSVKRARAYANRLGTELAIVDKKRIGPNQIQEVILIGDVKGKTVVLIDDMVDTGGTLCEAARLLMDSGAKEVFAATAHPILSGTATSRIQGSRISKLMVADTLYIPEPKRFPKLEILSSASLFGEAIRRIHLGDSISSLFD
jgi:ribose-phosphate pyrophosphokinase